MSIKVLASVLSLLTMIVVGTLSIESRYALSADVQKIESRLDYKILMDQYRATRERIWMLKDRHGENLERASQSIKEEYRQLQDDIQVLWSKIKSLKGD